MFRIRISLEAPVEYIDNAFRKCKKYKGRECDLVFYSLTTKRIWLYNDMADRFGKSSTDTFYDLSSLREVLTVLEDWYGKIFVIKEDVL